MDGLITTLLCGVCFILFAIIAFGVLERRESQGSLRALIQALVKSQEAREVQQKFFLDTVLSGYDTAKRDAIDLQKFNVEASVRIAEARAGMPKGGNGPLHAGGDAQRVAEWNMQQRLAAFGEVQAGAVKEKVEL